MVVKKFIGYSHSSVLEKIRREIGSDAVILYSSFKKVPRIFRFFARSRYEIIAGKGIYTGSYQRRNSDSGTSGSVKEPDSSLNKINTQLEEIKRYIKLNERVSSPEVLECLSKYLSYQKAREYYEKLNVTDSSEVISRSYDYLKNSIRCNDGVRFKESGVTKVAFVGPTGVGKTTTIAKLLSIYNYRGKKVSVLSNDNYRIAAYDQLKRICDLVGVEVRKVIRPGDVKDALADLERNCDLLLMDTAGRGQFDSQKMKELLEVLNAFNPDETHLVLSVATDPSTLKEVVQKFKPCGITDLVLTKLDECVKPGNLLDVTEEFDLKLSFITKGQKIPQDIEIADSERIASLILKREQVCNI